MKYKKYICFLVSIPFLTLFFLVFSCSKNPETQFLLQEAEHLMSAAPDSAYAVLKHADSTAHFNRAQQAEWNLLITQAMDKAYMEHTTDSLIREATSYYEKHKNSDRLILSYYYMGRVLQELGDAPRAQEYYLKALDIKPEKTNYNQQGLIYNHIGGLYTRQSVYDKALVYLQEAALYMEKAGNQRGHSFVLRDIGRVYHQLREMDQSIFYYQKALEKATSQSRPSILTELAGCYTDINQMDSAQVYMQEALACVTDSAGYYISCLVLGQFFTEMNKPDSALYYLKLGEKSKRLMTQSASFLYQMDIARHTEDWKEYADLHAKYMNLESAISKQKQTEIIRQTEQLYNYKLMKKEAQINSMQNKLLRKNMIILALVVLIVLVVSIILVFHLKRLRKSYKDLGIQHEKSQKENEELIFFYSRVMRKYKKEKGKSEEKELKIVEMKSTLKEVASRTDKMLQDKERFEISLDRSEKGELTKKEADSLFTTSDIYLLFQNNTDSGRITEKNVEDLFRKIDFLYPNFQFAIRYLLPKITDSDICLCYCIKANISNKQIETILNCTENAVTSRKYRLSTKVKEQCPEMNNLPSFIHSIY